MVREAKAEGEAHSGWVRLARVAPGICGTRGGREGSVSYNS